MIVLGLVLLRYARSTLIVSLILASQILAAGYFLFGQSADTVYLSGMSGALALCLIVVLLIGRMKLDTNRLRWFKG